MKLLLGPLPAVLIAGALSVPHVTLATAEAGERIQLTGRVHCTGPLPDALVVVVSEDLSRAVTALTDDEGKYHVTGLSPGKYWVRTTGSLGTTDRTQVVLEAGERREIPDLCPPPLLVTELIPKGEPTVISDVPIYRGPSLPEAVEKGFADDIELGAWLADRATNYERLLGLVPMGNGRSLFVFSQNVTLDSVKHRVMLATGPVTVKGIERRLRAVEQESSYIWLNPGSREGFGAMHFVGVHVFENNTYAMVFRFER